jgi:hypothetical protein
MICEICKKSKKDVRFEGSFEGNICDSCLNYDWKDLFNMVLDKIEKRLKKLTIKQIKEEYEGYFEDMSVFKTRKELLNAVMNEEYNYKNDYSEHELREVLGGLK